MKPLGTVAGFEVLDVAATDRLSEARLALHYAAQLPSAAGNTLIAPREDFSHTSLTWLDGAQLLASQVLPDGRRVGLSPRDLTLTVLADDGSVAATRPLSGESLKSALAWLGGQLGAEIRCPDHDLPEHALGAGGHFPDVEGGPFPELARWFGNAARVLDAARLVYEGASVVRCWPHHFDIATLIRLDSDAVDSESARSVGIGMTPGDGGIAVPYFYVTPWPYPAIDALPTLEGGGFWNTEGWVGAVLRADALPTPDEGAEAQRDAVAAFVTSAVSGSLALLR